MSNNFLKPIDTYYKGYKFRSRLEARWAVFFDSLNLKWQYEVEGLELSNGEWYLPDFKVKGINDIIRWYEIKPYGEIGDGKMQQFENDYYKKFIDDISTGFTILSGDPYEVLSESLEFTKKNIKPGSWFDKNYVICPRCAGISKITIGGYDVNELYFQCYLCDFDTPCGGDNPMEVGIISPTFPHKGVLLIEYDALNRYTKRVESACSKARSARFE